MTSNEEDLPRSLAKGSNLASKKFLPIPIPKQLIARRQEKYIVETSASSEETTTLFISSLTMIT